MSLQSKPQLLANFAKPLVQTRPAVTTAVTAYTVAENKRLHLQTLAICNTTTSAATYSMYLDFAGTTYNDDTAIYKDITLAANSTISITLPYGLEAGGSVGIKTSVADALNFTFFGFVEEI